MTYSSADKPSCLGSNTWVSPAYVIKEQGSAGGSHVDGDGTPTV
ncbi:MAG: hypothetical protein RID09_26250 [Coleofasciculus sp. G1-WW12-02]